MVKLKSMQDINIIMIMSNVLLVICFINLKYYSVSNIITIIGLISFSLIYAYNHECVRNYVRKIRYGQQYKIMFDINKIIKDNKKNDVKIILNKILDYYNNPNNNYNIEEYLSRIYKLENNYLGEENFKHSLLSGFVMFGVTELVAELLNIPRKYNFSFLVSVIAFISMVIFISSIFKILRFLFFYPTKEKGLNKVINDIEREIINKKIKQFINDKEFV
ncbi:hypothetical protein CF065_16935 [Clostridium sporogenes]